MWLRNSVKLGGVFSDCQAFINAAEKSKKFARYQEKREKRALKS